MSRRGFCKDGGRSTNTSFCRTLMGAWLAVVLCLLMVAGAGAGDGNDLPHPFTDEVYDNNYSKYVHHRSFRDQTYITLSATPENEPWIWSFDHETGEWTGPMQVGPNQLPPIDQHGRRSECLALDENGFIAPDQPKQPGPGRENEKED